MATQDFTINGKALYTTKGAAREYGRIGCNFYTGCPHDCTYCYLKRGAPSKYLGGKEVWLKKCFKDEIHAADILQLEMDRWIEPCRKYGIFLSFTTDPMLEETRYMTVSAIYGAIQRGIPVWVLTKDSTFIYDATILAYLETIEPGKRQDIHFGFTLTGRDDMEPNASTNVNRIAAMRQMSLMGFSTWASIEPVIDWNSAEAVIRMSINYCDHYKIGLRSGVKKDYYDAATSYGHVKFLVNFITTEHNKTVYLKESVRKLLSGCPDITPQEYKRLLDKTVDMDFFTTTQWTECGDDLPLCDQEYSTFPASVFTSVPCEAVTDDNRIIVAVYVIAVSVAPCNDGSRTKWEGWTEKTGEADDYSCVENVLQGKTTNVLRWHYPKYMQKPTQKSYEKMLETMLACRSYHYNDVKE